MTKHIAVIASTRTPFGSFNGQFSQLQAYELGALAIQDIIKTFPVKIDEVLMGNVIQAGLGQSSARQASIKAGIPQETPCVTINKVCGSSMQAIIFGCDAIKSGRLKTVIAGGQESMTNSPFLLEKARQGYRFGHKPLIDSLIRDGLEDAFFLNEQGQKTLMGEFAEETAKNYSFSRDNQEEYIKKSYMNYQSSISAIDEEITPIVLKDRKGTEVIIDTDEPPSNVHPDKFSKLRPAFGKDGSITAATASPIADGAAILLLMDEDHAKSQGIAVMARIVGASTHAQSPQTFATAPIGAIKKLLEEKKWTTSDIDLFEVNEAFAVVPMAVMHDLNIPREKMNIFGGACILGHPLGASGARLVITLINALTTKGLKRGIASACIGGGEAIAIAVEII